MNIEIRKYVDDDFDYVNKIIYDSFGFFKSKMAKSNIYEYVAVLDSKVVGYFYLLEVYDIIQSFKIYQVNYVCVDVNHRGLGIGNNIMEYIISDAKKNNVFRIDLTSSNNRKEAHQLYLKYGFIKRDTSMFRKEIL